MRMAGWVDKLSGDHHRDFSQMPASLRSKGLEAESHGHFVGDIKHARAEAMRLAGIYKQFTAHEHLEMMKETAFVFGDRAHAVEYAEALAKFKLNIMGNSHDPANAGALGYQVMAGIRALELKGAANDPKVFFKLLGGMAQAITASGGTVKPHDYLMAMKHARTAGFTMSDNFFQYVLPTLSQELGGSTVGTSLMTLQQAATGIGFNAAQIYQLKKMGLIAKGTKFEKAGFKMRAVEGGIEGGDTLRRDPWEWVQQTLVPAFQKRGFNLDKREDQERAALDIGRMFPDRTAADIIRTTCRRRAALGRVGSGSRSTWTVAPSPRSSPSTWRAWRSTSMARPARRNARVAPSRYADLTRPRKRAMRKKQTALVKASAAPAPKLQAQHQTGDKLPAVATVAELTPAEQAICERYYARQEANPTPPFRLPSGGAAFELDHPRPSVGAILVMHAMGTASPSFFGGLVSQLAALGPSQVPDVDHLNFACAIVRGVAPQDEVEGMLAALMAAIHVATMRAAHRLARCGTAPERDSASTTLNKCARTFAAQVEALKRYRSNGEQLVKVQDVTVNGQAVVGNVNSGRGRRRK